MLALCSLLLSQITVTLPAEARVSGAEIRLGEIATVAGGSELELARVRGLQLGYAPAPGYSRLLPRWKIEQSLAEALPGAAIGLRGEPAVRVLADVRQLAAGELEAAARAALLARLGGQEAALGLAEPIAAVAVPSGSRGVTLEGEAASERSPGRWTVAVRVRVDGALYRTVWTTWQVEQTRSLPVLVRDVPLGEAVGQDAVRLEQVRVDARLIGNPIDASSLVGTVAARPLSAGAVLLERDVRRELLVRQNELVHLEVKNGSVVARVAAVARQNGHHGAFVRVQVAHGGREINARVIGQDLVQVALGESR